MQILLTNDDGINGEGLSVLFRRLSLVADVFVLAPDSDRSGVSHGITMEHSLALKKVSDNRYSCSGVPADCVITALRSHLFNTQFDAVIAGINRGANLGTDVVYSGTAAAARQAVLYGVPGIAVSLDSIDHTYQYDALADFTAKNLDQLISMSADNIFVSVNALSAPSYSGVSVVPLCRRDYRDTVKIYTGQDGNQYSIFSGGYISSTGPSDCDYSTVRAGKIAVSRILAEPSHADLPSTMQFLL